ncbi:MAG: DUF1653 domain-containing protein [Clostridiales bacterium]|nr:DUF1653 domain-containing protein [Clostridiales bacterium]
MDIRIPNPGEIYKHFKDKLYQVVTVAKHSETGEMFVVYQALYGDFSTYVRPLEMFISEVDHEKYPSVLQKYRFEKIEKLSNEKEQKNIVKDVQKEKIQTSEGEVNSDLLDFLDAETFEEKKNLLVGMRSRMTDSLINSIAASLDITVDDGEIDDRYKSLFNCISTIKKYEVNDRPR